jgi:hypothetical protein
VEPERFDDVEFRIVEAPEPPRRPPRGPHVVLGIFAALLATGALAAGASALTSGADEQERTTAPPKPRMNIGYTESGVPFAHDGRGCRKDEAAARALKELKGSAEPRY